MIKITHLGVYEVHKDKLFENVNSYSDLNKAILKWAKKPKPGEDDKEYRRKSGLAYEIFAQFFTIKYGQTPRLGITNIQDTSTDPNNPGYDFTFQDLYNNPGLIQVKWRDNDIHEFPNYSFSTFNEQADLFGVLPTNRILFINFDVHPKLFHYKYQHVGARLRIIDRKAQESYINLDPKFWSDFRKCIEYSSKNYFRDKPKLRDVQEAILYGDKFKGLLGTQAVINGIYKKGKVEASTATGKSLCIQENIESVLCTNRDIVVVTIPTLALISQTFNDYYTHKLFGWEDAYGNIHDTNISCILMMSGQGVRYDNTIADVTQSLEEDIIIGKILTSLAKNRKVVIIITLKSYHKWYKNDNDDGVLNTLIKKGVKQEQIFEIVDEYHNLIPSDGKRLEHLEKALFLTEYSSRNSGTIFYSASNKNGEIISSFNEEQFGPLLAKVTRQDLYERGYVCPGLLFKIIKVDNIYAAADDRRELEKKGVDINKVQIESAAIVKAFLDAKNYYQEPNMITFGNHVAGCQFIANDPNLQQILSGVDMHFIYSKTSASKREIIIEQIKKSGNNILNQHSVAKEGVNIPNLHAGIIDRGMDYKTAQQAIGRTDRALYEDTLKFQRGEITLDNPQGWKKYWNLVYVVVSDIESTAFAKRINDLVRYLKSNGVPKDKWPFSFVDDDDRVDTETKHSNTDPNYEHSIQLDYQKLSKIIDKSDIITEEEFQNELGSLNDIFQMDYAQEIEELKYVNYLESLSEEEYIEHIVSKANEGII